MWSVEFNNFKNITFILMKKSMLMGEDFCSVKSKSQEDIDWRKNMLLSWGPVKFENSLKDSCILVYYIVCIFNQFYLKRTFNIYYQGVLLMWNFTEFKYHKNVEKWYSGILEWSASDGSGYGILFEVF